jgi:acyl-ACP thioesterase
MKNFYSANLQITPAQVDMKKALRFDSIMEYFQDAACLHSVEMGVEHDELMQSSNAFWVLSKVKFRIDGIFLQGDEIVSATWPLEAKGFRFVREHKIEKADKTATVHGRSEWCILDAKTLMLKKATAVKYPNDMVCLTDRAQVSDFNRFNQFENALFCYDYKTLNTDIDVNLHVNNVAYARMAINALSKDEYKDGSFNAFEIHFISQSYLGDVISIYKQLEDTALLIEGKLNDKTVFKARFYNE